MALVHRATITPTKPELLAGWVPTQGWLGDADTTAISVDASFRFDDPAGEVGIETMLVGTPDGRLFQVPLTYRAAPLDGAEAGLITTMTHSVLGPRWIYDATADPLYVAVLAEVMRTGGRQADLELDRGDGSARTLLEPSARVEGSGDAEPGALDLDGTLERREDGGLAVLRLGELQVGLVRRIDAGASVDAPAGRARLTGTWTGRTDPVVLAVLD